MKNKKWSLGIIPLCAVALLSAYPGVSQAEDTIPAVEAQLEAERKDSRDTKPHQHGVALWSQDVVEGKTGMWIDRVVSGTIDGDTGKRVPVLTEFFLTEDNILIKISTTVIHGKEVVARESVAIDPQTRDALVGEKSVDGSGRLVDPMSIWWMAGGQR